MAKGKSPRPSHKKAESYERRRPIQLFQNRATDRGNDSSPSQDRHERVDYLVKLGIEAFQARRLDDAVGYLTNAISLAPRHAVAYNCLGIVHRSRGDFARAIDCYEKALECEPNYAEAHNNLGVARESQCEDAKAAVAYQAALAIKPRFAAALNNLGSVLTKLGRVAEAVEHFDTALREQPDFAAAHNNLGLALCRLERSEEAEHRFRRALALQPKFCEALVNLGNLLRSKNQFSEAAECYRTALDIRPQYSAAHSGLGNVLLDLQKPQEALASYDRALESSPDFAEALFGKGNVALSMEQCTEAETHYKRALQCSPNYAEAYNNLGSAYRVRGMMDKAEESFKSAVQCNPELVAAHNNLGNLYRTQDRLDLAASAYGEVLRRRPQMPLAKLRISTLCPAVFDSRSEMDAYLRRVASEWESLRGACPFRNMADLVTVANEPPYNLQFFAENIRPLKEAYAAIFRPTEPIHLDVPPTDPIRIGCVVTKGHEVAFLRLTWESLRRMNRDEFEVAILCDPESENKFRMALDDRAIRVIPIPTRPELATDAIRSERFHVLYYFEICTDASNYFLPFFRLAPVQVTTWGIQVTSGIPEVDCYLSSELVEGHDADDHYSERLIRATTLLTYQKRVARLGLSKSRRDFGFSEDQHLYVCAQHLGKFHPDFDILLAEVLRRDSRGVIVGTEDKHGWGAKRLRHRWNRDIPDVAERIVLLPRLPQQEYLSLIAVGDVMLDPLHFGGVSTTYDCLSLEKAIVTLPSPFHRGRYTAGCFKRMGIRSCVARDAEEYVRIAVSLGSDAEFREQVSHEIRDNLWRVFEDRESVTEHERIFRELVQQRAAS